MGFNAPINAAAPPFWLKITQMYTMMLVCCSRPLAELAPQWHWHKLGFVSLTCLCSRSMHSFTSGHRVNWTMTRPRGKPRRGSAWKPRRPSTSRHDSSSLSSSSHSLSDHPSFTSPRAIPEHSTSRVLVPRTVSPPPPVSHYGPEADLPQASRGVGPLPRDSPTSAQLNDNLATLFDLVFDIRQGVDDLIFRLQETDGKVDLLLSTLTSLRDSLAPKQDIDSPMQEQNASEETATDEKKETETGADSGSNGDNPADDREGDQNWADQVTSIEEKPRPEDLQPKGPNYSPGV
jgi:hypothetical protein